MQRTEQYCGFALALALSFVVAAAPGAPADRAAPSTSGLDPTYSVGSWIWAERTSDKQTCRFWKLVEIPHGPSVTKARLRITADNSYRVFLDGREFGQGSELRSLTEYDLSLVLTPGAHVLAVEAFNEYAEAGVLAGLRLDFQDGRAIEIPSDSTWRVVPENERGWERMKTARSHWPPAKVIAPFLGRPWVQKPVRILFSAPLQPVIVQFWQAGWFQIALLSLCALAAIVCLRLLAQLALQSQAEQVLQRERARIARDIHDDMEGGLTQLVLFGEVAQTELPAGTEMRAKFEQVSEKGRRLLRSIDEIVWMINSQRDTLRDFETYVCRYAEEFLRAAQIRCRLAADAEIPEGRFDLAIRRNLFLATKEALNNAVRHSGATEVRLNLHVGQENVLVVVEDNGKGFDPAAADSSRHGLSNMAVRTAEVGGSCRIVSQPGTGCRVELAAPLAWRPRREHAWWRWPRPRAADPATEKPRGL